MGESPRQRLCLLENACRRQVFDVTYLAERAVQEQVREINAFCRKLLACLPTPQNIDLVQAKNQEIKRLCQLVHMKTRSLLLMYIWLKQETQALQAEQFPALCSPLFEKFSPVLFHRNLQDSTDPDLPFLPVHVTASNVLPLQIALARASQFYELLEEIRMFKRTIKHFYHCNDTIDIAAALETCQTLEKAACDPISLISAKWNIDLPASDVLLSQVNLAKALLCHINSTLPDSQPLPFQADLALYSEDCLRRAEDCRNENEIRNSGYWVHVAQKINGYLGISIFVVVIYYGEALNSAGQAIKALSVLKAVLKDLSSEEYDSTRTYVMKKIASIYQGIYQHEKAAKWYSKTFRLQTDPTETTDTSISLSNALRALCRYEECEAILICLCEDAENVDTNLCNLCGFLYLTWEKWDQSESWLKRGLALPYGSKDDLSLNFVNLCFKQGKLEEAEQTLAKYIQTPTISGVDRAYALTSLGYCYMERMEWRKAREALERASVLQRKWKDNDYAGRTLFFSGLLSSEIGKYVQTETELTTALNWYKHRKSAEFIMRVSCALAEIYLQTERLQEAATVLTPALELTELMKEMTPAAAVFAEQGRVCLARQELVQAREWLERALAIQERVIPHSRDTARVYISLGSLEIAQEKYAEGYDRFKQALQGLGTYVRAAEVYWELAELSVRSREEDSARGYVREGLQLLRSLPEHPLAIKLKSLPV